MLVISTVCYGRCLSMFLPPLSFVLFSRPLFSFSLYSNSVLINSYFSARARNMTSYFRCGRHNVWAVLINSYPNEKCPRARADLGRNHETAIMRFINDSAKTRSQQDNPLFIRRSLCLLIDFLGKICVSTRWHSMSGLRGEHPTERRVA